MSTSSAPFLFLLISLIYLPLFMLLHEESSCFLFISFFYIGHMSHIVYEAPLMQSSVDTSGYQTATHTVHTQKYLVLEHCSLSPALGHTLFMSLCN